MSEKRILYIITKLELGGAQKQLLSLICRLDRAEFHPLLFASSGILDDEARAIGGLELHLSHYLDRSVNILKDLLAFWEIYRFIRKNKIDIVHTHSSKAGILGRLAAKAAGVKVILHSVHGWSFHDFQNTFAKRLFLFLERSCAAFTDKIIVVSKSDKSKGLKEAIGEENKYKVIPYGINHDEFYNQDNALCDELNIPPSDILVGMVACFKPQKAPLDYIKVARIAAGQVKNVKFVLIGDGALRSKISKLISEYNLKDKVFLAGWRQDVPKILPALDIFLLTSLWEGFPVVALEACAAGKPVLVTNTGGIAEFIQEGKNGFLINPGETEKMAEKLLVLINDEVLRKQMGEKARQSVQGVFLIDTMVNSHQSLYRKALNH